MDIDEALELKIKRDSEEIVSLNEFEQCVVDQNRQVDLLKTLIVLLFDIKEFDCAKDNYLTKFYKKYI